MSATCFPAAGKLTRKDVNQGEYRQLESMSLPHVTLNDAEDELSTRILEILDAKSNPTPAETTLWDLLTMLIEHFEEQHYALPKATPLENLAKLMQTHNLKHIDLVGAFGRPVSFPKF